MFTMCGWSAPPQASSSNYIPTQLQAQPVFDLHLQSTSVRGFVTLWHCLSQCDSVSHINVRMQKLPEGIPCWHHKFNLISCDIISPPCRAQFYTWRCNLHMACATTRCKKKAPCKKPF